MNQNYSNLPLEKQSNSESTLQAFDTYSTKPLEINMSALDAVKGFFESRKFEPVAAESIAILICKQAKKDGYNPMQILDTLKGLADVELSSIVTELLNYNRFKTSSLGYAQQFSPNPDVQRNVMV